MAGINPESRPVGADYPVSLEMVLAADRPPELVALVRSRLEPLIGSQLLAESDVRIINLSFEFEAPGPVINRVAAELGHRPDWLRRRYQVIDQLLELGPRPDHHHQILIDYLKVQLNDCRRDLSGIIQQRARKLDQSQLLTETDNQILDLYLGLNSPVRLSKLEISRRLKLVRSSISHRWQIIQDLLLADPETAIFRDRSDNYLLSQLNNNQLAVSELILARVRALLAAEILDPIDASILSLRTGSGQNRRYSFWAIGLEVGQTNHLIEKRWAAIAPLVTGSSADFAQALADYRSLPALTDRSPAKESGAGFDLESNRQQLLASNLLVPIDNQVLNLETDLMAISPDQVGPISRSLGFSSTTVFYSRLSMIKNLLNSPDLTPTSPAVLEYLDIGLQDCRQQLSAWLIDRGRHLLETGFLNQPDHQIMIYFLGLDGRGRLSVDQISDYIDNFEGHHVRHRLKFLKNWLKVDPDSPAWAELADDYFDRQLSQPGAGLSEVVINQARALVDSRQLPDIDNQIVRLYLGLDQSERLNQPEIGRRLSRSTSYVSNSWRRLKPLLNPSTADQSRILTEICSYDSRRQTDKVFYLDWVEIDRARQLIEAGVFTELHQDIIQMVIDTGGRRWPSPRPAINAKLGFKRDGSHYHMTTIKSLVAHEAGSPDQQQALVNYLGSKLARASSRLPPIILDRSQILIDSGLLQPLDRQILQAFTGLQTGHRLSVPELRATFKRSKHWLSARTSILKQLLKYEPDSDDYRQAADRYRQLVAAQPASARSRAPAPKPVSRTVRAKSAPAVAETRPPRPQIPAVNRQLSSTESITPVQRRKAQSLINQNQLASYMDEAIVIHRYNLDDQGQLSLTAISQKLNRPFSEVVTRYRLIKQLIELDESSPEYQTRLSYLNQLRAKPRPRL